MLYTVYKINLYCDTALSWIWIIVPCHAKYRPTASESPGTLLETQSLSPWKTEWELEFYKIPKRFISILKWEKQ